MVFGGMLATTWVQISKAILFSDSTILLSVLVKAHYHFSIGAEPGRDDSAVVAGLAFAVAASANLPVIVFSLFWRRFNTSGAIWGLATGPVSSLGFIVISPSIMDWIRRT